MSELNVKENPSFSRAVWSRVWNDVKRIIGNKLRMLIAGIMLMPVGYIILAEYGSADAAYDFGLEKLLVIPLTLIVMMFLRLLWSWATAPRRIYYGDQSTIKDLEGQIEQIGQPTKDDVASSIQFDGSQKIRDLILQVANEGYSKEWRARTRSILRGALGYRYVREFNASLLESNPEDSGKSYLRALAPRVDGSFSRAARLERQDESPRLNDACDIVWQLIEDMPVHEERLNRSEIVGWRNRCSATLKDLLNSECGMIWKRIYKVLLAIEDTNHQPDEVRELVETAATHLRMAYAKLDASMLRTGFD